MAPVVATAAEQAEILRQQGKTFFAKNKFGAAIDAYTEVRGKKKTKNPIQESAFSIVSPFFFFLLFVCVCVYILMGSSLSVLGFVRRLRSALMWPCIGRIGRSATGRKSE